MKTEINAKHAFWYTIKAIKPFPLGISVMLWLSFIWAIDLSVRPYLLKIIINRVAENNSQDIFSYLTIPVLSYLFMFFLMSSSYRLYNYFVEIKTIPHLREKIASEALGRLYDKSHHYYQNHFSGSLANKLNNLTDDIPFILQLIIDRLISRGLALIIAIYTLWTVNAKFAICMSSWSVLLIMGALFFSKRLGDQASHWSECSSRITGQVVDMLSNILSVRLFSTKRQEKRLFSKTFEEAVSAEKNLRWSFFIIWLFYGYNFVILLGFNFYFLLKGRQEGWITIGDFTMVVTINIAILDALWETMKEFCNFSRYLGRIVQALKEILNVPEVIDKPGARVLQVTEGKILFDKVKFHYKDTKALFYNKSITIEPGQKVGLVGYSGSGKSTFVNLILRLYDVNEGRIMIDGQDIRDVMQDSLHSAIAMIPQDPSLFHRSLMDNIRYGRIDATNDEVIEAAMNAHAHDFITKLSKGYESLVGERGVKLSGGQRQRIAIARAILKNAPILILDEATSQLDSVTEGIIQDSLWKMMQDKTTIVIAHRLSTLLHMDRILVFDQGKIIEDNTHHELLNHGRLYKTLWDAQVGGFLPYSKQCV
jgi:ATP-binding cassette, subfamily B, bacterial